VIHGRKPSRSPLLKQFLATINLCYHHQTWVVFFKYSSMMRHKVSGHPFVIIIHNVIHYNHHLCHPPIVSSTKIHCHPSTNFIIMHHWVTISNIML
jgi:hypothetical protein